MKKTAIIIIILLALHFQFSTIHSLWAQAPQGFTYQAVVRNNHGTAVANQQINVRISLVQGSALGVEQYAELHNPTTDAAGLFSVIVGQGSSLTNCTMADCIDWADGPWFLKTQIDPAGGENFTLTTTQQLMSVPYALYAANAGEGVNVRDSIVVHDSTVVHIHDSVVVHVRDSVIVHVIDSVIVHLRDSVVYDTFPLHPYDHSPADVEGTLPGVFSISAANRVAFSRGNLQYRASTNTWRFAEHQEDMVGTANANISATDTGWIDLFGYGTSGYNGKEPYRTSGYYDQYPSVTITATAYDWGVYNTIQGGGDTAGVWRTLTKAEWEYILSTRTDASNLRARATVGGIPGLLLLPDNWTAVSGITILTGATNFTTNNYNNAQWSQLQDSGAVFLPAAGWRGGVTVNNATIAGYYWTSTLNTSNSGYAYIMAFGSGNIHVTYDDRPYGHAVRLARDLTVLP